MKWLNSNYECLIQIYIIYLWTDWRTPHWDWTRYGDREVKVGTGPQMYHTVNLHCKNFTLYSFLLWHTPRIIGVTPHSFTRHRRFGSLIPITLYPSWVFIHVWYINSTQYVTYRSNTLLWNCNGRPLGYVPAQVFISYIEWYYLNRYTCMKN